MQRREAIARLQARRSTCLDDAPFLAALGALLLDDDAHDDAVVWLERSLLLDPDNLGAQADLAIAMAHQGEAGPLAALIQAWRHREDVPDALRGRLVAASLATSPSRYALGRARLGGPAPPPRFSVRGELAVLRGHETNLDRSPRLTELSLSIPEGPLVLPVAVAPRRGQAWLAQASVQAAYAAGDHLMLRTGLNALARDSGGQPATNWQQFEWVASAAYQRPAWAAQVDAGHLLLRGPLGDPFDLSRLAAQAELRFGSCNLRLAAEAERRHYSGTQDLDARYEGGSVGGHCVAGAGTVGVGLVGRRGRDEPLTPFRPGGVQDQDSISLRIDARWPAGVQTHVTLRQSRAHDRSGYSVLLENNAVRHTLARQALLELVWPLRLQAWPGRGSLAAVAQLQRALQDSNLALFKYSARSSYAGLRYGW